MPKLIFILLALVASVAMAGESLTGRVIAISDGDTLTLLTVDNRQVKIRLAEIDTPESKQPYGTRARQALSDLAFGKSARVDVQETDRYGRSVGRVFVGATDVNAALVEQGAAWVYRQYARDPRLLTLEAEAKAARRGLWALPEAERMPPWEWRRGGQSSGLASPAPAVPPGPSSPACGSKRTCGEMASCAEARHYLNDCGLSKLDRDGDGVPCESLCK